MKFERLGPYRIGERLGVGGMGEVYEGVNEETGERAAIKVLNPVLARADGFRERFEAEIESLRKLRHPNIVSLYGFGEHDGYLFYAMELVDGRSIEDELRCERRFEWREITDIGIQLCKALKHAHDHGVIHRDLKPANILISSDNHAKLLDFGIARLFGNTQMTSAGGVLGTADYMSPEQADGQAVTERCDQYSLGGVLYALATGRPPFQSTSLAKLLDMQRHSRPDPVRRLAPSIPVELERIIMQLLEKQPKKRFPNMLVLSRHMAAMQRALSLHRDSADFELADPESKEASTRVDVSLGQTQVADPSVGEEIAAPPERNSDSTLGDEAVHEEPPASTSQRPLASDVENRFTRVTDAREYDAGDKGESRFAAVAQIAALAAAMLLLGAAVWYFSRSPTADQLYSDIDGAAELGQTEDLLRVESSIDEFLASFPGDARAEEVQEYRDQLDLAQAERRMELRARRRNQKTRLSAVETHYLEAIRLANNDPHRAAEILRALIDLYSSEAEATSKSDEQCLRLAEQQLSRLNRRLQADAEEGRAELQRRLKRADEIQIENPHLANTMYQAIITLGQGKPWAADAVKQARERLERGLPRNVSVER